MKYIEDFIREFVNLMNDMSPYLLLGFLIAGVLHVFIKQDNIRKYLGTKNIKSVIYAALIGVPLPLCSCGVIPTAVSFHRNGASKGSSVSFLISTPQTGVDSILVTYSMIGLPFALIRPIVALLTGVFGGWLTNKVAPDEKKISIDTEEVPEQKIGFLQKIRKMFSYAFVGFMQDIASYLLIGLAVAALIAVVLPDDFFSLYMGSHFLEMLLILVASIPIYICATGSVPIAAVLLMKGISPGAALVLLMAGPATNAATISVIGKTMGRNALVSYLVAIIAGSLLFGSLINVLFDTSTIAPFIFAGQHQHVNHILPEWINITSSLILSVLLLNAIFVRYGIIKMVFGNRNKKRNDMGILLINVNGMTCNHCKNNVEKGVSEIEGVDEVHVDLANKEVKIQGENLQLDQIKEKIESLGYECKGSDN
jgi:uncharacterized membrane protein YraQ (UPF0718 family)/copper chaperone CopZ